MSQEETDRISRLRLVSANRRIEAFLEEVLNLQESDFPHLDSLEALEEVEKYFEKRLLSLSTVDADDMDSVNSAISQVTIDLDTYTSILGFILRSTNVRNPFEIHYSLKNLVRKTLGDKAKLILSSEWDWIPFTYPIGLGVIPDYVLIAGPAPDSGNVLITPLAGHEIGHSIWIHYGLEDEVKSPIFNEIEKLLENDASLLNRISDETKMGEFGVSATKQRALSFALLQIEEIFCDFCGTYIFGEAFIYAFDYFLAPGFEGRSIDYPSNEDRLHFLKMSGELVGLSPQMCQLPSWVDSNIDEPSQSLDAEITDPVVRLIAPYVLDAGLKFFQHKNIGIPDQDRIEEIRAIFEKGEPVQKKSKISEIIAAGWRLARSEQLDKLFNGNGYTMLMEIMLKSIEMSEFEDRMDKSA